MEYSFTPQCTNFVFVGKRNQEYIVFLSFKFQICKAEERIKTKKNEN